VTRLHLDYETRSAVDLIEAGLHTYARDKTTRVLMAAWAIDDEPVQLWLPHVSPKAPPMLRDAMRDPSVEKWAWNAPFERAITENTLGLKTEGWRDTMVMALYASLPGSLALAGMALRLPSEDLKDPEGKRLIRLFSMPRKPTETNPALFNDWNSHPEDFESFGRYCIRDVHTERTIYHKLKSIAPPASEWKLWELDQEINQQGVPVDLQFVEAAIEMANAERESLMRKLRAITGLENPKTQSAFLKWAQTQGYPYNDLKKATVERAIREGKVPETLIEVMRMRGLVTKTSTAKFDSIIEKTKAGRIYNMLQFYGASRTGRWGGRDPQPQNLPRPMDQIEGDEERVTEMVRNREVEAITDEFGAVIPVVSSLVRSAFRAPSGYRFYMADLNAIENRVLGWLFGDDTILDVFREKRCPYLSFAVHMYKQPYEELLHEYKVEKVKFKRQNAKPAVLGCFAAETEVLTKRGWVQIIDVTTSDWVHDGLSWVPHSGVVFQGEKPVINLEGVRCTPDHKILTGQNWREAGSLVRDESLLRSALALANGLLRASNVSLPESESSITTFAAALAERALSSFLQISKSAKRSLAFLAPTAASTTNSAACREPSVWSPLWLSASQIASTRFAHGVSAGRGPTRATPDGGSSAVSILPSLSSSIASRWRALKSRYWRLIGSTTTGITRPATSVLRHDNSSAATVAELTKSSTAESITPRLSFASCIARAIETLAQLRVKLVLACPQKKSLPVKTLAAVPTYDIVNAGPNNRFVIRTNRGPLIAHNCGYMLSGGEEVENESGDLVKTGLWGYSEQLGVKTTREEAHAAVRIFREAYPKVVQGWANLKQAAFDCVRDRTTIRVGPVTFKGEAGIMRVRLPSGRVLHYLYPRIEDVRREFTKTLADGAVVKEVKYVPSLSYEGVDQKTKKWVRLHTHGGRLTENLVQAIARDVLAVGLMRAKKLGFKIILHVHDEIVCEVPDNSKLTIDDLCEAMASPISWAQDLPLAAEGHVSLIYKK